MERQAAMDSAPTLVTEAEKDISGTDVSEPISTLTTLPELAGRPELTRSRGFAPGAFEVSVTSLEWQRARAGGLRWACRL